MGVLKEMIRAGIDYFDKKESLELEIKKNPIASLNMVAQNKDQVPEYDISAHLAVYVVNVYCFAAIRAIARDVAATPFLLQREKIADGEWIWEDVEREPLNKIFELANPHETFPDLIERTTASLLATGNGYNVYAKMEKELWYVKPDFVTVQTDGSGNLKGYLLSHNGYDYDADLDEIIHFRLSNPNGEYYGFPPSQVIKEQILTKLALNGYIKGFFKNNALAGVTFSTDQPLTEEQKKSARESLDRLVGGFDKAFKTAVLDRGQKLDRLSHNMKDLVPKEINDMIREDVGSAYGVPPAKLGLFGSMTFENADIMDKTYMRDTVRPIARKIASTFTYRLVPLLGQNMRLWWNEDSVKVLQDDQNEKAKRHIDLKQAGIITANEARNELGWEPHDDEGADELGGGGGNNPFEQMPPLEEDEEEQEEEKTYSHRRTILATKELKDFRDTIKLTNEAILVSVEKGFIKIVNKYWDEQLERTLRNMKKVTGKSGKLSRTMLKAIIMKGASEDATDFFDLYMEDKALEKKVNPYLKAVAKKSGKRGMSEVGVGGLFYEQDPRIIEELANAINRMKDINKTTFNKLIKLLQEDYANGETISTISEHIQDMYKGFTEARAETIARTEMNAVVSAAKMVGGMQAGATHKEWFSTLDSKTRRDHGDADGQIVAIDQPFKVGGDSLLYPGDPVGRAHNVINCRCSHVNIVLE